MDRLIQEVENSELIEQDKSQVINFLKMGKKKSARQKCLKLIDKYAKSKYGYVTPNSDYTAKQIFNAAYSCRSDFSHGNDCDYEKSWDEIYLMKYLILDVIKGYMLDFEEENKKVGECERNNSGDQSKRESR